MSGKRYESLLDRMYFTGDDGYQNFLVFTPMLSSPILDSNKKVTNSVSTRISFEKIQPFDTNLGTTMSNLANGRVILKLNNFVLVQKSSSSMQTNFISNLYIVYELNNWPRNRTNNSPQRNSFGTVKLVRNAIKFNLPVMIEEQHLMEKIHGVLIITLLEMLQFVVLIIVHHFILIIKKLTFQYQVKDQQMV